MMTDAPSIEELNDPATHARIGETGELTRYANNPVCGPWCQNITDEAHGIIKRVPVLFWYEKRDEGPLLCALVGGHYLKNSKGEIYRDAQGKRKFQDATRISGVEAAKLWNTRLTWISRDTYNSVMEGNQWPGVNAAAEADRQIEQAQEQAGLPGGAASFTGFKARVDALLAEAANILQQGPAKDINQADAAGDVAGRLARLEKLGPNLAKDDPEITDDMRRVVAQVRDLTGRWKTVYDPISLIVSKIKREIITPFQIKAKAEAEKRIADAAARGVELPRETAMANVNASGGGRTIALRTYKYVSGFTDYAKALEFVKDAQKVKEAVMTECTARLRKGEVPPGCEVTVEERST